MKIVSDDIEIESNVDKGLYYFEPESATGKTRLCNLVRLLKKRGLNVGCYSYDDYLDEVPIKVEDNNLELFIVDRYDMYPGAISRYIDALCEKALVIIDSKCDNTGVTKPVCGELEISLITPTKIMLEDPYK